MNEVKDHRVLKEDGHYYWIMRVNAGGCGSPRHQAGRAHPGVQRSRLGDPVGSGHRAGPAGTVHSYESCAVYDPLGAPGDSPDRGGCVNILTPKRYITPTSSGMARTPAWCRWKKWTGDVS